MFCYKLASGQFYKPNVFTLPIRTFNIKLARETFNSRRGGSLKWGDEQGKTEGRQKRAQEPSQVDNRTAHEGQQRG